MANKITGKIIVLTPTETLTARSGNSYRKREIVIERTMFDRNTGLPTTDPEDTPIFRVFGNQASELDNMAIGDMITVHYELEGRSYLKDGVKNYFTDIRVFRIEPAQQLNKAVSEPFTAPQTAYDTVNSQQPANTAQNVNSDFGSRVQVEDELPF